MAFVEVQVSFMTADQGQYSSQVNGSKLIILIVEIYIIFYIYTKPVKREIFIVIF